MYSGKEGNIGFIAGNWPLRPDRPAVVFLHGAALSKGLWAAQVEGLSGIANTIAIDLPGHKDSAGDAYDRISDYALEVSRFLDRLKIQNPVLCGMSMGGAIAMELLITETDRFRAAILMNTGARLKVLPLIFETIQKNYAGYLDMLLEFSTSKKSDRSRLKAVMDDIAVSSPEIATMDFIACDRFDAMSELGRIAADVLVITGDEDAVTPPKYGQYLHQRISGARMTSIPDCGHLSPIEQPERVCALIREFIDFYRSSGIAQTAE